MAPLPPPLPEGGLTFTYEPSVAALNISVKSFVAARPIIANAAASAIVFSRATGEDRVLLIQRAPHDSMPLLWEVPGGACDPEDETILHAVGRELWEEAGLKLKRVVRQVGPELALLGKNLWAKVTCEVEVEVEGGDSDTVLPKVTLDPNEHLNRDAMATPPGTFEILFDSAQPFKGVVVCCTSVPTELRADIAAKTTELGGQHKYDLTPDCTHLIVGDYDTPKYRHVAKERPDVRVMAAGWVEAVRNVWVEDAEVDFLALEKEWQLRTFETGGGEPTTDGSQPRRRRLLCCMTGFENPGERQKIIDKIVANGGDYTGDLTKRVTHLIVHKPEGRKYQAAKAWGVATVSVEWVNDSVERGLILDEKLYDPILPQHERGVGAWNKQRERTSSLGKRLRENKATQEEGQRKLRKTASMKLNSQRDNLWGDILGKPQVPGPAPAAIPQQTVLGPAAPSPALITQPTQPPQPAGDKSLDTQGSKLSSFGVPEDGAIFASCCFYVHGFSARKSEILVNTVASLGGLICHSLEEVVSASGAQLAHRFVIVPQTAAPETHPHPPDNVYIITEFYIERCMHKKYFFDPSQHAIGRPFPLFPIPGFEGLVICTAGFTGVDLNQVDKSVRQLGAKYEERFTANVSLLLCASLTAVRKQKLELALAWKVPVVSAEWLWKCIASGSNLPIRQFLFSELKQQLNSPKVLAQAKENSQGKNSTTDKEKRQLSRDEIDKDLLPKAAAKQKQCPDLNESVFVTARENSQQEPSQRRKEPPTTEHDSNITTTHFATALTHALPTNNASISFGDKTLPSGAPLSETSSNSLNRAFTSPRKPGGPAARRPISRVTSEVADSEATEGDIGQLDDLPPQENEENTQKPPDQRPEPPNPEADRKRLEDDKAAAERLAISTKLVTSILDSAATTAITTVPTPAGAALPPGLDASGDETPAELGALSKPKRRKRNILGRAISNVSAASSTSNSGDASAPPAAAGPAVRVDSGAAAVIDAPPLAATQLEYEDPDARRYKEQLMSKMMGKDGAVSFSAAVGPRQEKLTLAEMGGYDAVQQHQQGLYDAASGGGQRRTRRR
ncbi:hypothetical protein C7999DRAFT_11588 [Corynascus novoguineensis]|uniref:Uncharacterized protein n=1 Tax=Corynascus novoguineensis TaxID=1126955 RepID=A0AAN7CYC3_9PEZI|nr:hypothetical protein C7999DRAFT_11588 [Corynascus novoguineensis]